VAQWTWFTSLSLVHGPLHLGLMAGSILALLALVGLRWTQEWWIRGVPVAGAAAGILVGLVWVGVHVARPWPDPLPVIVLAWIGAGFLGLALLVTGWGRRRWYGRVLSVGAAAFLVVGAADGVDTVYGAYPTVSAALQLPPHDGVAASRVLPRTPRPAAATPARPLWATWHRPVDLPSHGAVIEVAVPAHRSEFTARPAWVYLPPAYLRSQRPLLPVLLLVAGQPGTPRDWLDGGQLAQRMDAWANAHGGLAPVVVMPDALGAETANPLCMDSSLGKADTYLSQDVVTWAVDALQVDPDHAHWAVGGFSYGGTCALQLATAHPDLFPTFYDASGQVQPTLGDQARTVAAAFRGNRAAFDAVDPLHELAGRGYPGSAGYLVVGKDDRTYRAQARAVAAATRAAGMTIRYTERPGRHSWDVAGPGLADAMPWLATRMGLMP
jgi:S-formylglutathione hydrolase FrmB